MKRSFIALIAIIFLATMAVDAGAAQRGARPAEVSHGFFKTVFGLEYGGHADARRVKRFVTPVRFHISDRSGHNRTAAARRFVASLPRRIKHFDGRVVSSAQSANFRILIVKRKDFAAVVARELQADAIAMNARCLVGVTTDGGRIRNSVAVIVGDDDYLFSRCLIEETLQGLGPMNDNPSLTNSVFNDRSKLATFTPFDQAILNVLYHPSVRPGMTKRQARSVLPHAMHDLGYR
ncbi:DUF2927 domain-containing protein [Gymnodinialimonas sp.]